MGLAVVELAGLLIHTADRFDLAERSQIHEDQVQVFSIYRTVAEAHAEDRQAAIEDLHLPPNFTALLLKQPDPLFPTHPVPLPAFPPGTFAHGRNPAPATSPPFSGPPPMNGGPFAPRMGEPPGDFMMPPSPDMQGPGHLFSFFGGHAGPPHGMPPFMRWAMLPSSLYPRAMRMGQKARTHSTSLLLPDCDCWVVVRSVAPLPNPLGSPTFLSAFMLMSLAGSALIVWATRRMIAPVTTLANAAEALGRDVNTAALPETGPSEIRRAAIAFNTMATHIRRFVTDRTLMLTAIGHDLRTPITRLKLRAEFIDDDNLRDKILADLDEMEAMVAATLAFGRDSASNEPVVSLDLRALLQTIVDEAAESRPDMAENLFYESPAVPVRIRARSVALKRALNNLILNALKYGGSAQVTLLPAPAASARNKNTPYVRIIIEDNGPGLPPDELERVFEPFVRVETSRNRETGGTGLGLSIARTILRGQGGDVRLENRPEGGLRVLVTLAA
ncbi:ATP-binding protein [Gluconobacter morbifer]|uniref:histidine kinase n=1 Tax=Gluconobacter morbifer G707 TaxID=1088869 RepID=G6XFN5_9PROT|nr:ATP-binding protein [Gluconobacter morbifer]EHH68993.1 two component sensor histidine kinase [Gluconobacter morbifer G707]